MPPKKMGQRTAQKRPQRERVRRDAPVAKGSSYSRVQHTMRQMGDKLKVAGTDFIGTILLPGSTAVAAGQVVFHDFVSLQMMANTRVGALSELYERYHVDKWVLRINGGQSTSANEQFIAWFDPDPSDEIPSGDSGIHEIMSMTNSGVFKSWERATLRVPPHRIDKWLYTDAGTAPEPGTTSDGRLYSAGYMGITAVSGFTPPNAYQVASVWVDYEITFDIPQMHRPAPTVAAYQKKIVVTGAQQIAGTGAVSLTEAMEAATGTKTSKVRAFRRERATEAEIDGTNLTKLRAGKYLYEVVYSTVNGGSAVDMLRDGTDANAKLATISVSASPIVGASNPVKAGQTMGRLGIPGNTAATSTIRTTGYFELMADSLVSWMKSSGPKLDVAGAATALLTVFITAVYNSMHNGYQELDGVTVVAGNTSNGASEREAVGPGPTFAWLPPDSDLPEGWHWTDEEGAAGPADGPVARAPPCAARCAQDDWVDDQECETMSRASSARGIKAPATGAVRRA